MLRPFQRIAGRTLLFGLRAFAKRKLPPVPGAELRRIAVFRFGGIGDCIVLTALLRTLRLRLPHAHIAVVTLPSCRPVFEGNPDVDEILVSEPLRATVDPFKLAARIRALRRWSEARYDLAIFTHNPVADLAMAPFFRARYKAGFETNDRGFDFALTHSARRYGDGHPGAAAQARSHVVEHFHDVLRAVLGEHVAAAPARIKISADEARAAQAWLRARGLTAPLIALAPGGTESVKLWPVDRFAAVARRAAVDLGASVVVLGGADEASLAPHFASLGEHVRFAAGELTLRQSFALLAQASALVASDTGMVHAGAALGVPLVSLFGPTPDWVYGYEGEGRAVIKTALGCVPCSSLACRLLPQASRAAAPCMAAIATDDVLAALRRVWPHGVREALAR